MPESQVTDHLDVIPRPDVIHRRIAATARAQRLLRRLLRLSLTAQRERESAAHSEPARTASAPEVANAL